MYKCLAFFSTLGRMQVAITELRAGLASWIERARSGEEVVVTDRGVPVARLLAIGSSPQIEQLTQQGVISGPRRSRGPTATGARRVVADGPVADLVTEQRR